jgi:urease accessory protein
MPDKDWIVWQLVDSAFPAGGFVHSGGLEAASQLGFVRDRSSLDNFLKSALVQALNSTLVLVMDVYQNVDKRASVTQNLVAFEKTDKVAQAITTNHIANRASRAQGQALLLAASAAFNDSGLPQLKRVIFSSQYVHFPTTFGLVCKMLEIDSLSVRRMFLFVSLRGLLSSAVRLNVIGPLEAQGVNYSYSSFVDELLSREQVSCETEKLNKHVVQTNPILDLIQGTHDKLYSRLFNT